MKKTILYSLFAVIPFLFAACDDENIPNANFETMEVASFDATSGDGEVTLTWELIEGAQPQGYFLTWLAATDGVEGGEVTLEGNVLSTTITNLLNGETYTFTIQPIYKTGKAAKATLKAKPVDPNMADYVWRTVLQSGDVYGQVKASTPAFSPDGSTVYISLSGPSKKGDLIAVDQVSGEIKWIYSISAVTYGGGPSVGSDGTIYTGARDKNLYAVNPDGTPKWSYTTDGNVDCFPAIDQEGKVYVVSNDRFLYSINIDGSLNWKKELEGAKLASGVAIDSNGKIFAGTDSYVYAFDISGNELWKTAAKATEISTFAIHNETLYVPLKAGAGLMAINIASGKETWTYAIGGSSNDAYSPIIGKDGSIYFAGKNGKKFYAVKSDGTEKWTFSTGANMVYVSPAIDEKGNIYFGTDKNSSDNGQIFALNSQNGSEVWKFETTPDGRFMSGVSIGTDKKLYLASLGSGISKDAGELISISINAGPETSTWSMRGGNIYGNNRK